VPSHPHHLLVRNVPITTATASVEESNNSPQKIDSPFRRGPGRMPPPPHLEPRLAAIGPAATIAAMRLMTAHRILIGSAAIFFAFLTVQRLIAYRQSGGADVLATAGAALVAAVGMAAYLRSIKAHR